MGAAVTTTNVRTELLQSLGGSKKKTGKPTDTHPNTFVSELNVCLFGNSMSYSDIMAACVG